MHVPGLAERVRLTGHGEIDLVARVDEEEKVVDLLPIVDGRRPLTGVAFLFLEAIPGFGAPNLGPNTSKQ